jgi:hypothetical protein
MNQGPRCVAPAEKTDCEIGEKVWGGGGRGRPFNRFDFPNQ